MSRSLGRGAAFLLCASQAAMFGAQTSARGGAMGMNPPRAERNAQFVLNVLHWLSGLLEPDAVSP